MQTLGRLLASQLRPHVLHGSPLQVTAVSSGAAAAAAAGGLLSSIRQFSSSEDRKRLYIGNLSFETTPEELQQAFEKFGAVRDCLLPRRFDGKHRGFGFIELDAAAADAAIQDMHESQLQGRTITVKEAEDKGVRGPRDREWGASAGPRPPRQPVAAVRPGFMRLYVGNLNFRTTAADLGRHFQQYGAVQDCVIPLDHSGRSKGFGFIELDEQGAAAAMESLDGSTFDGRTIVVRTQSDRPPRRSSNTFG